MLTNHIFLMSFINKSNQAVVLAFHSYNDAICYAEKNEVSEFHIKSILIVEHDYFEENDIKQSDEM